MASIAIIASHKDEIALSYIKKVLHYTIPFLYFTYAGLYHNTLSHGACAMTAAGDRQMWLTCLV